MILTQNKLQARLKYFLIFTLVILCFLFLALQYFIPYKIKNYLNDNPQWKGNNLKAENIEYSLLSGFHFTNLEISKPDNKNEFVKINNVYVDIGFLSSIYNRKVSIEHIEIDSIDSAVTEQFLKDTSGYGAPSTTGNDKQRLQLEIQELVIKNFDIAYEQETNFKLTGLILKLGDLQNLKDAKLRSKIEFLGREFSLQSNIIRTKDDINILVDLQTPEFVLSDNENTAIPALNINSIIDLKINGEKKSKTNVQIHEEQELIGKADIDIVYKESDKTVIINDSVLEIFNLIKLGFRGDVTNISDDPTLDITANVENLDIEKFTSLFTDKYNIKLSGNLIKNEIKLAGSIDESLTIKNLFNFDNFLIKQGSDELEIGKLDIVLENKLSSKDNNVNIKASSNSFAGGSINLNSSIELGEDNYAINGRLSGNKFDLGKIFYVNNLITGSVINLDTRFTGNTKTLNFLSDISANNVSIKLSDTQNVNVSHLNSSNKIQTSVSFDNAKERGIVDAEINNLSYKNLDYVSFKIDTGKFNADVKDLLNDRNYNLNITGDRLENNFLDVTLDSVNISVNEDEGDMITGNITSPSGSYDKYKLSDLKSDYSFTNTDLNFSDITFILIDRGRAKINEVSLPIEEEIEFPSKVNLKKGTFTSDDNGYKLVGINMNLNNNSKETWTGNVTIKEADIYSVIFTKLVSIVSYDSRGYKLSSIKGSLLGGKLTGFLNNLNNNLRFNINLSKPKIEGKENIITTNKLNLTYKGKFKNEESLPTGSGKVNVSNMYVEDYEEESKLNINLDIDTESETLSVNNGLISNSNNDVLLEFTSNIENPYSGERKLEYKTEKMNLAEIKKFANPYLPPAIRFGEISGSMDVELTASNFPNDSTVTGYIDFKKINFKGDPFGTLFNIENLDGRLKLSQDETEVKSINEVIKRHTIDHKKAYKFTKNISRSDESNVNIKRLEYGFFTLENIKLLMNVVKNNLTIKELSTNVFGGKVSSSGVYNIGKSKKKAGKFYFLFNDISLKNITDSIPGTEGYISGRLNGLVSLVQKEKRTSTLDGLFNFWTVGSRKEKRIVGKAFLERLGARERLLLGSSKNYDKGRLYGYINNGVITFNELEISNSILGLKDLNIKVHNRRNSISVAHLMSVIRETARRASTGSLDLQFQN